MRKCPRFHKCSAPICPLDSERRKRIRHKDEPKCELGKSKRMKLGHALPWKGLFPNEMAAKIRWEKKSKKEKAEYISKMSEFRIKSQFFSNKQKDNLKDSGNELSKTASNSLETNLEENHAIK